MCALVFNSLYLFNMANFLLVVFEVKIDLVILFDRMKLKVAPSPGLDCTQSLPKCISTIFEQIAKPIPVFSVLLLILSFLKIVNILI